MSLGRVHVWLPGEILTAQDLNTEFNNVLDNPAALISPSTGPINFNAQAHSGLLPSAVTASSATAGQIIQAVGGVGQWVTAPVGMTGVKGLVGTSTAAATSTATFYLNEALVTTTDYASRAAIASTASFSVNANHASTSPIAGGRDQGSTFSDTGQFLHFYLITTGVGSTTPAGIASLVAPPSFPTLPTGYSMATYLHSIFYTTGSVLSPVQISGATAYYPAFQALVTSSSPISTTTGVVVSYSTAVPSHSLSWDLGATVSGQIAGESVEVFARSTSDTPYYATSTFTSVAYSPQFTVTMPVTTSGAFVYTVGVNAARTTRETVLNYRVANGDA